jgi:hypothetical protein
MKTYLFIIILILPTFSHAQSIKSRSTVEILEMAKSNGLDSLLNEYFMEPLHELDNTIAKKLIVFINSSKPTTKIDWFIAKSNHFGLLDSSHAGMINNYYQRKLEMYKSSIEYRYGKIIEEYELYLLSLIDYRDSSTEGLLIDNYNFWTEESKNNKKEYLLGAKEGQAYKREHLQASFVNCHINCSNYLVALNQIGSDFFSKDKLQEHNQYMNEYDQKNESSKFYHSQFDFSFDYDGIPFDTTIIDLNKEFNTLEEIPFNKVLKNFAKKYSKRNVYISIITNSNKGYLSLTFSKIGRCSSGNNYRIELVDRKKLVLYRTSSWIS